MSCPTGAPPSSRSENHVARWCPSRFMGCNKHLLPLSLIAQAL
jgi:hypothetical protein